MLENLVNIEMASKIILGSLMRKSEVNPLDYIYSQLGVNLEYLAEGAERDVIEKYCNNTW